MEGSGGKGEFVFCGACGAQLDAGVRFCTACGVSQAEFAERAEEPTQVEGEDTPVEEEAATDDASAGAPTAVMGGISPAQSAAGSEEPPSPPPPPVTPAAQPGKQRGFFESLLDPKFEDLITPKLIRFFYVLSMIVLTVGAIGTIVAAASVSDTSGILFLFLAPLTALVYLIVIRLWLELIVVAFRIRDAVERIADNTQPPDA